MIPTDTIDKLAACFASLSELGAHLTESEWKTPTDCPGWTVQDNMSHLIGIERVLNGLPGTSHRAPASAHVKNPIGEANENEIDSRRGLRGAEVLAEWNEIAAARLATLRRADEAYFAKEAMTPTGPGTVADFLHIRVLDCWVHEQDMRRAVGKRAGTPDGASVVIDITGGVQRHIICTVTGGRASVTDVEPEAPVTRLTMDTESFLILATGRRAADTMLGSVELAGDVALGNKIVTSLNMMI